MKVTSAADASLQRREPLASEAPLHLFNGIGLAMGSKKVYVYSALVSRRTNL